MVIFMMKVQTFCQPGGAAFLLQEFLVEDADEFRIGVHTKVN